MNPTHLHLMLNHVPILVVPLAVGLLAAGILVSSRDLKKAALVLFVLAGLVIWPVYLTGEPAEETVENLPGVSESLTEQHEDAAKLALIFVEILAVGALGGLILSRMNDVNKVIAAPLLGLGLVATLSMGWVGYLGGQIRHTEVRSNAATVTAPESGAPEGRGDDDD
ncbi:MAG: hypothetical protein AMXMBFR33_33580 [Candidatus Xenobia bacterium]